MWSRDILRPALRDSEQLAGAVPMASGQQIEREEAALAGGSIQARTSSDSPRARERWIVWTVCGLAVVVSLFVLALPWSTRYLVDRIAVLLSDRYDIDFSADRVEFALRSLSLTLHDVRLATGTVAGSATVVAKRVNLDLATAALRGNLAFDRIEIVDPSVLWIAGGRIPASSVPHATRPASRPVVSVGRLDVVNLDATVSTASSLRLMVQGLSASFWVTCRDGWSARSTPTAVSGWKRIVSQGCSTA